MAKYTSGRQKNLKVGLSSYSENLTSLEVIGKVGIGTTNATSSLYVVGDEYVTGVVTATTFYGTFSGNSSTATYATNAGIATYATNAGVATYAPNSGISTSVIGGIASVTQLSVSGISTLGVTSVTNLTAQQLNVSGVSTLGITSVTQLNVSGVSTFVGITTHIASLFGTNASFSGVVTANTFYGNLVGYADRAGIATYATNAGIATYATNAGIATNVIGGIASVTQLNVSGISTLGVTSTTNLTSQQLNVSGISTLGVTSTTNLTSQQLSVSGISTLGVTSATNLTSQQLNVSGISTSGGINVTTGNDYKINTTSVLTSTTLGSGVVNSSLTSVGTLGQLNVSGVVTAATFNGQVNAGVGTITTLNSTTANISTGNIVTGIVTTISGTNLNYTGVGTITNLSNTNINSSGIITASRFVSNVAQGTAPITVGSSTLVTNLNADYLDGNDSTYYTNASNLVSGTVAAGRLQNANSFNVLGDLNVTGNISIGGTSAFVVVNELVVKDKDLLLGFTTNASNQDASTDNTANHGGIAIASTEGSYLVPLQKVGLNTLPETYKQFMWTKNGTFGVGTTDAWISNNAIGIGSTQVPNGVRLAVGGVQVTDTTVTATTFSGNASSATYATNAGIATYATSAGIATYATSSGIATYATNAGIATNVIGGIASVTQLNVSGITTLGVTSATNLTSQQLNVSGISTLGVTSTTNLTSQQLNVSGVTTSGGVNVTTGNDYKINAISVLTNNTLGSGVVNSSLTSVGTLGQLNVTGVSTLGVTSTTNLTSQQLNVSGISTLGVTSTTNLTSQQLNVSGITTTGTLNVGTGGTIITTTGIGSVGIGSTLPGSTLVVNAPSGYTGNVLDLRVGGSPKFQVDGSGSIYFQSTYGSVGTDSGAWFKTSIYGGIRANWGNGGGSWLFTGQDTNSSIILDSGSGGRIGFWTQNQIYEYINPYTNTDLWIYRDDAGVLAQRNAGIGQTFRVYNTYTSATNFERANVGWTNNVFIVGTEKGSAGGTARQMEFQTDGITRVAITTTGNVGIGTTIPTSKLTVQGDVLVSGIITASSFSGNTSSATYATSAGIATYATNAGIATNVIGGIASVTQLSVSGFSTVGVLTATSIGIGTTNPTVALWVGGSGYFIGSVSSANGFYVNGSLIGSGSISGADIVGTALSISGISTLGTVKISSGIVTATSGVVTYYGDGRYLQNVVGFAVSLQSAVSNPVYPMFANNSGVTTAGISTTQLVFIPSSGNLGLGSTNPDSKLSVIGDVYVSGVLTATAFKGNADTATYATNAGTSTSVIGGIASVTQLNVSSGITTLGVTSTTNLNSQQLNVSGISTLGITSATNLTSQQLNVSGISTLGVTSTTNLTSQQLNVSGISTLGVTSATNLTSQQLNVSGVSTFAGITTVTGETLFAKQLNVSGVVTATTFYGSAAGLTGIPATRGIIDLSNITTGTLYYPTFVSDAVANSVSSGIGTTTGLNVTSTKLSFNPSTGSLIASGGFVGAALSISGISTLGVTSTTNLTSQQLYVSGISTLGVTSATNLTSQQLNVSGISTLGVTSTTNLTSQQLNVSGISTFANGPILIGSATSTGTASQRLQVTGGAYVSGSVGLGTTNPQYILTVSDTGTPATSGLTNCLADFTTTANSYGQINLRNTSAGVNASSDFIVTADTGNDTTNYIDLGINNSGFSVGSWTINGPTDGYLYTSNTNLSVGSANTSGYVSLFAGGTLAANEKLRANNTGVGIGTTNPQATLQVGTAITMYGSTGIISATKYFGDGTNLTGVLNNTITASNSSTPQFIGFSSVSSGVNTSFGASATLTYIPSTGSLGIGTTNPTQPLHVLGNARVTGAIYDSTNSPGSASQTLLSTVSGTQWSPIPTPANIPGLKIFDTSIDNTLYVQPTGTLDRVGVGTTVTQITTFPSGSNRYVIHSIHVTNISNGDAEITGGFLLNSQAVPASISVGLGQSGRAGVNTITVGSASTILIGASVNGTGNIGETTGIGSTAGFQYNTYVTSVDGTIISLSKPMSGRAVGVATFTPVSKFASRLPVPVGSAVELLKQPMILNALDSIVLQSTGVGTGIGATSTAAISQTVNSNLLTVTAGAAITNFIAAGQLIQGTGSNTGIQTNTFVGVGYTPGTLSVPMTRPATVSVASTVLSFTEVITPQDGALQATIVYQSSTDTSYLNGTGTVSVASTITSVTAGLSSIPVAYYATGNTYGSTIQSIRVSNISDGTIYPGGDYPVSVGIGNSDTIFSWLAYNMVIPRNSSIELCEGPKRLGIGQSIFAIANTPYTIEIQVAGKQKTS